MLVTSSAADYSKQIVDQILTKFPGKPCGEARQYNGMKVSWLRDEHDVILSQPKHIQQLVDKFSSVVDLITERKRSIVDTRIRLCKSGVADTPAPPPLDVIVYKYCELIGGLSYIACCTRPDILWIVNQLARYSNDPRKAQWDIAIGVLKYLKHTNNWGICLGQGSRFGDIVIHCDPDVDQESIGKKRKQHDATYSCCSNNTTWTRCCCVLRCQPCHWG
jgi:hypothetical protein